ncbi:MAG: TetR/AcrR family transcriptional regulator [Pseudomonadota bacterium]
MSAEPRYQRRKEDRPKEIAEAAFEVFAEKGYASARIDEVAKRAGVSKGLTYLYFKTKEELFKAVIRGVVVRRVDTLIEEVDSTELTAEAFLRGPMLEFMQRIPGSKISIVLRLLMAEGHRHPDLLDYYYENVVGRGLAVLGRFLERGVENGEFRRTAVNDMPQLILAPMILSVIWKMVFAKRSLDTDRLIESHMDMILTHMRAEETAQ